MAGFDEAEQLPLGHDRVVEVEAGELDLSAGENAQLLNEPLVQGTALRIQSMKWVMFSMESLWP